MLVPQPATAPGWNDLELLGGQNADGMSLSAVFFVLLLESHRLGLCGSALELVGRGDPPSHRLGVEDEEAGARRLLEPGTIRTLLAFPWPGALSDTRTQLGDIKRSSCKRKFMVQACLIDISMFIL